MHTVHNISHVRKHSKINLFLLDRSASQSEVRAENHTKSGIHCADLSEGATPPIWDLGL
jgi:hypothetical protein